MSSAANNVVVPWRACSREYDARECRERAAVWAACGPTPDLTLLVDTQHHRLQWRIEVQADDVANLVNEQRIARELEGFLPMRLQAKGSPDSRHRSLRKTHFPSHRARTPVRRFCGYGLHRLRGNGIDTSVVDRSGRTRTRRVEQTVSRCIT